MEINLYKGTYLETYTVIHFRKSNKLLRHLDFSLVVRKRNSTNINFVFPMVTQTDLPLIIIIGLILSGIIRGRNFFSTLFPIKFIRKQNEVSSFLLGFLFISFLSDYVCAIFRNVNPFIFIL